MATQLNLISRRKSFERRGAAVEDTYLVQVDDPNDFDAAISALEALPPPGLYVRESVSAQPRERNPHWFEGKILWRVNPYGQMQEDPEDPLSRPSLLSVSYEEFAEAYDVDHSPTPKPVLNSAGLPFQSVPERKNGNPILQIAKNVATVDVAALDSLKYTTNASSVQIHGTTYPADTLLFLPPTVQEQYEQVGDQLVHYYQITYRLAADAGKHKHKISDRGFYELDGGQWKPIINPATGQPAEDPWPLDGSGRAKAAGAEPATLTFVPYKSVNWGIDFS